MQKINGFTEFKHDDANQMGRLSFYTITTTLLFSLPCIFYLALSEKNVAILGVIVLFSEIIVGTLTLICAINIEKSIDLNDTSGAKSLMKKGRMRGVLGLIASLVLIYGFTYISFIEMV